MITQPDNSVDSSSESVSKETVTRLPNKEMLVRYPHWCETMCAAWSHNRRSCNGEIMSRDICRWDIAEVERRISEKKRMNGNSWWR